MQPEKPGEQNYWQPSQGTISGQASGQPAAAPQQMPAAPVGTPTSPPAEVPASPNASSQPTPPTPTQPPPVAPVEAAPVAPPAQQVPVFTPTPQDLAPITWSAPEFSQHDKSPLWFVGLIVCGVLLLAGVIIFLKDWFFAFILVVLFVGVWVVAARKPRILQYALDDAGIHVGETVFPYEKFHAFSLTNEGELWSVILMPNARFSPTLTLYFDKEQGEEIVDTLNDFLPMEEHKADIVDYISRKIRF